MLEKKRKRKKTASGRKQSRYQSPTWITKANVGLGMIQDTYEDSVQCQQRKSSPRISDTNDLEVGNKYASDLSAEE